MYNSPIGWVCSDCGESKPWMETKRKQTDKKKKIQSRDFKVENTITIGKYSLDGKILKEYVEKVEYLRRAVAIGRMSEDPIIIQNALIQREKIHRKIYKSIKLHYHSDLKATKESIKFNELLDVWLTNTPK